MKDVLDNLGATLIVGTFIMTLAFIGTLDAQTANTPHATGNASLAATPSSGVVNQSTSTTAPAASNTNTAAYNSQLGQPNYATANANSGMNATPASGQPPAKGATLNSAGDAVSH